MSEDTVTVTSHPSWPAFMIYMLILVGSNGATAFGVYEMGKAKGIANTVKENPQNVYNCASGRVEVDQSSHPGYIVVGAYLGKAWGIGICHK